MTPIRSSSSPTDTHRRQVFWQVIFPLLLVSAALLVAAFFLLAGGKSQTRLLADVATIVLLLPLLFLAATGLLALVLAIILLSRLLRAIPPYAQKAQEYAARGRSVLRRAADLSVRPVFWLKQADAVLRRAVRCCDGRGERWNAPDSP